MIVMSYNKTIDTTIFETIKIIDSGSVVTTETHDCNPCCGTDSELVAVLNSLIVGVEEDCFGVFIEDCFCFFTEDLFYRVLSVVKPGMAKKGKSGRLPKIRSPTNQ